MRATLVPPPPPHPFPFPFAVKLWLSCPPLPLLSHPRRLTPSRYLSFEPPASTNSFTQSFPAHYSFFFFSTPLAFIAVFFHHCLFFYLYLYFYFYLYLIELYLHEYNTPLLPLYKISIFFPLSFFLRNFFLLSLCMYPSSIPF